MSEVEISVGANITPFQKAMAQVKLQAKETGESLGLEFDRGAARAERRVERGMSEVIRSIASAKNPIDAITGAIEGLGRAFMIASTAFLVIGIGAALYEQFRKAAEGSDKLHDSIEKLGTTNVENESVHQLQRDVDEFQKVADQYENRGLLQKIFFGGSDDKAFADAANLNELKKNVLEMQKLQDEDTRSRARLLEASDNPDDKRKGRALAKSISDKQEMSDLDQQLQDAQDKQQELLEKQARAYELQDMPTSQKSFSEKRESVREIPQIDDRQKQIAGLQKEIDLIKQNRADLAKAQAAEVEKPEKIKPQRDDSGRIDAAIKHQAELKDRVSEESMTGERKVAELRKRIQEEQNFVGPETRLQTLERENLVLEDQYKLTHQIAENEKDAAEAAKKKAETESRLAELQERREELVAQQAKLRSSLVTAMASDMGFHGAVSSLRRVGFGHAPASSHDNAQLRAIQELKGELIRNRSELEKLNAKTGTY